MSIEEFTLPDVGEGVAEGELVRWLVEPGDRVEEDQPVAEVETDKALVEVPSRYDGVVEELFVEAGDVVPVGDVIISFRVDEGDAGEDSVAADDGTADPNDAAVDDAVAADDWAVADEPPVPSGRTFAPPSVRRLARELGVDVDAVAAGGSVGRITESAVRAHATGDDVGDTGGADGEDDTPAPKPVDVDAGGRRSAVRTRGDPSAGSATRPGGQSPKPADRETTLATPATRRLARELGVDIDDVPTDESRAGEAFVAEGHVRAYATGDGVAASDAGPADEEATVGNEARADDAVTDDSETPGAAGTSAAEEPVDRGLVEATDDAGGPRTIPYRGVRRTIGERMERSKFTAPHVSHHDTVAVDRLVEARDRLRSRAEAEGVRLTYLPFVMKAVVSGLQAHPILNAELREADEEIVIHDEYHLGIAVATDAGLMVPVVEDVDEKGLFELAAEVSDLAARARDRSLSPAELSGSTFTITNFGAIGGEYATPIINHPETAILGLGAIEERPVVRSGDEVEGGFLGEAEETTVVPAPTLPLSLSIDHRVVDGAVAAAFTNHVMEQLEHPLLLLNE